MSEDSMCDIYWPFVLWEWKWMTCCSIYGHEQWKPGTRARVTIYFETFIHGHQATLEHLLGKSTSCLWATLQTAHNVPKLSVSWCGQWTRKWQIHSPGEGSALCNRLRDFHGDSKYLNFLETRLGKELTAIRENMAQRLSCFSSNCLTSLVTQ